MHSIEHQGRDWVRWCSKERALFGSQNKVLSWDIQRKVEIVSLQLLTNANAFQFLRSRKSPIHSAGGGSAVPRVRHAEIVPHLMRDCARLRTTATSMPARNSGEGLDVPLTRANIEPRSTIEEPGRQKRPRRLRTTRLPLDLESGDESGISKKPPNDTVTGKRRP